MFQIRKQIFFKGLVIVINVIILLFSGCTMFHFGDKGTKENNDKGDNTNMNESVDLFYDPSFERGLAVKEPVLTNNRVGGIFKFNMDDNLEELIKPKWTLAQWHSKFDISRVTPIIMDNGIVYKNEGKLIEILEEKGTKSITLEVYGSQEYDHPRKIGESWPHLLLSQDINKPIALKDYKKINFNLDVRIGKSENMMLEDEYDEGLHCCQTTAYFIIKDPSGDFIWFGIPIYDSRYDYTPGNAIIDQGAPGASGKLIYVLDGKRILSQIMAGGGWENIGLDMIPYIKEAYNTAQKKNFLVGSKFEDLVITHFNLGWEVTGSFDCSMEFKNLSLKGQKQGR